MTKRTTRNPPAIPSSTAAYADLSSFRSTLSPGDQVEFEAPRWSATYIGELQGGPVVKTTDGSWVWPALDARCRVTRSPNAERRKVAPDDDGRELDPVRR